MLLVRDNLRSLRRGITLVLAAACLLAAIRWMVRPNGAGATLSALLGFAALGVATWVAPIEHRVERRVIRVLGTLIGLGALALYAGLVILLRNGL